MLVNAPKTLSLQSLMLHTVMKLHTHLFVCHQPRRLRRATNSMKFKVLRISNQAVPIVAQWLTNATSIHEVAGSTSGLVL